jgi:hypothetical protein
VECGASRPNPSTPQKLRNNVQPATKGKMWLGEKVEGEKRKKRTVIEEDESHFKNLRKQKKA